MSNEQRNAELHERVARRMAARHGYVLEDDDAVIYRPLADVAFAALGLDDLRSFALRIVDRLEREDFTVPIAALTRALEAALAPPEDDRG